MTDEQTATDATTESVSDASAPSTINPAQLPLQIRRQIEAAVLKRRLAPKPFRREMNGAVRVDASDRHYAVAKDGALHRVVINDDGVFHVKKWDKARKKAEKRKRRKAVAS